MTDTRRFGDSNLHTAVDNALQSFTGVLGCYAKNLTTGEEFGYRADEVMPTASVIKVPIMAELYRQVEEEMVDLEQRVTIEADDWTGGTGVLKTFMPGLQPTIMDLCRLMIIVSDNVATARLVNILGKDQINQSLREWGLSTTELRYNMQLGGDIRQYAVSSTRDLGRMYELISTDGFLTAESCAAMRDHLGRQQHLEQIPRGLPFNQFASEIGVEQPVRVMNKIGNYMGVRVDAAIIASPKSTFVLVTMNEGSSDHGFAIDQEGNILNGRIGRIFFDAWGSE